MEQPNVVTKDAAEFVRERVFDARFSNTMDPAALVDELVAGGHGKDFPRRARHRRLRAWVLQVLRRLHRHGWLGEPGSGGWPTTPALATAPDLLALRRKAPRELTASRHHPSPPESWEGFVQDWVFQHRHSGFSVNEAVASVIQRGYVEDPGTDLRMAAREMCENVLASLEEEGLLECRHGFEECEPTELLRTWPEA